MKELMLLLGSAMPKESLIKEIQKSCVEYLEEPNDKSYSHIEAICMLLLSKKVSDLKGIDGALNMMKSHDEAIQLNERLKGKMS